MKKIAILGSTGSIGTQTLEVARNNGDLEIVSLAAGSNIKKLEEQIREFRPKTAAVWSEEKAKELRAAVRDLDVRVVSGMDGLIEVCTAPEAEIVVTAIVGMIGIVPTIAAMKAGIWETSANSRMYSGRSASTVRTHERRRANLQPMKAAATNQMEAMRLPTMGTMHRTSGAAL